MPELETLHCTIGDHDWERERKRGVKPKNCPEHKPVVESAGTGRGRGGNVEAMHEGKRRAAAERAATGIVAVKAWRKWSKSEAQIWLAYQEGDLTREQYLEQRPEEPLLPTANDWKSAREAGVVA